MRPSSLGGGRILRRTLSVCPSVCPSVRPSRYCFCLLFYSRTVLRANIQNRKTYVFAYGPASRMYFSAVAEGRISYGHRGRTSLLLLLLLLCATPFPCYVVVAMQALLDGLVLAISLADLVPPESLAGLAPLVFQDRLDSRAHLDRPAHMERRAILVFRELLVDPVRNLFRKRRLS